ncbi:MAG: transglycosylase domain-containing protein [Bdellovibrionales bacterium]|nr:transglycosylase domain-containing protein [Bdellovibrionales bacterium]
MRFLKRVRILFLMLALSGSSRSLAEIPSFSEVKDSDRPSELILTDQQGTVFDSIRLNPQVRKSPWVPLDQFSPSVRSLLVSMEDQHFFEHRGVDWFALGKSALRYTLGRPARGSSTIAMQLVSLIDQSRPRKGRRTPRQKIDQIQAALELDRTWTKEQILEAYLNLVPLRGEWVGVHSVAQFLFRRTPSALGPAEAALIVAMLPSPNQPWPTLRERACIFLKSSHYGEPALSEELCKAVHARVRETTNPDEKGDGGLNRLTEHYAHFVERHLTPSEKAGGYMKTSLQLPLQMKLVELARENLGNLREKSVAETAAIVLDHRTGGVLAYLGNLQNLSKAARVDGVQSRRQAGSTLKPFFFGAALDQKKFNLSSELLDEAIEIETANGAFRPENYDHQFHGWVPLPTALASSLNIPAIRVVQALGVDEAVSVLNKIGFKKLHEGFVYGPSIALGTVDVTLLELVRSYAALARQALGEPDKDFPIGVDAARSITKILSDNPSRSLTFGMNSVIRTPYFTAVKTGTSKDMRDNWCIGFSDKHTVGVWVGNFSGDPMQDVTGVSGAAPMWRKVMDFLNDKSPSQMPPSIAGIKLPEPGAQGRALIPPNTPRIVYPHEGSVLALDPDIPLSRQKVLLKSTLSTKDYEWVMDGVVFGSLDEPRFWGIQRGRHLVELRKRGGGHSEDSVRFLVK